MGGGYTPAGSFREGELDGFAAVFVIWFWNYCADGLLRGLAEDAGRFAGVEAVDFASGGVFAGDGDAGELERFGVGYGDVAVDADQENGILGGDFVEIPTRGEFFDGPESVIPTAAENPFTGQCVLGFFANTLAKFFERFGSREVDFEFLEAAGAEVAMGVVEAGHDEVSGQVDYLGGRAFVLHEVGGFSGGEDAVALDGDGVDALDFVEGGAAGDAGVCVGMGEDDVGFGDGGLGLEGRKRDREHGERG